jgi:hypothetical protein
MCQYDFFCKNFSQKFNVVLKSAEFDAGFVSFGKNVRNYWKNIRGPRTLYTQLKGEKQQNSSPFGRNSFTTFSTIRNQRQILLFIPFIRARP